MSWVPQAIACVMLLWAFNPDNPYGYYIFLRWVLCGVFGYLAIRAVDTNKKEFAWVLGITAVIYNPFIRVHLTRDTWELINLGTIVIAIVSIFVLPKEKEG